MKIQSKMVGVVVIVSAAWTTGCAASGPDEQQGDTSSELVSSSCVAKIKAPKTSQAYRDAVKKCIEDGKKVTVPAPAPAPAPDPGGGADEGDFDPGGFGVPGAGGVPSDGVLTTCVNGACTCGSGTNKGKACNGTIATGATACSVLCAQ